MVNDFGDLISRAQVGDQEAMERLLKEYGDAIRREIRFCLLDQLEGDRLVIEYGRGAHSLDAESGCKNAPRVLQKFAVDFSIQTTVDGDLPLPELNAVKTQAYVSGGLVIMQDEKNYIRFERASFIRQGIISHQIEADTKPRNTKD